MGIKTFKSYEIRAGRSMIYSWDGLGDKREERAISRAFKKAFINANVKMEKMGNLYREGADKPFFSSFLGIAKLYSSKNKEKEIRLDEVTVAAPQDSNTGQHLSIFFNARVNEKILAPPKDAGPDDALSVLFSEVSRSTIREDEKNALAFLSGHEALQKAIAPFIHLLPSEFRAHGWAMVDRALREVKAAARALRKLQQNNDVADDRLDSIGGI